MGGRSQQLFWADAASRVATVLMMQILPANDPAVLEALAGFEAAVYREVRV